MLIQLDFPASTWLMEVREVPPGGKVSRTIFEAAEAFATETGRDPQEAFVREIPAGAEEFMEIKYAALKEPITLIAADWLEPGKVAVTRPDCQVIKDECKKWTLKKEV